MMNVSMEKKKMVLEFGELLYREYRFCEVSGCLGRCHTRRNGKGKSQKTHFT